MFYNFLRIDDFQSDRSVESQAKLIVLDPCSLERRGHSGGFSVTVEAQKVGRTEKHDRSNRTMARSPVRCHGQILRRR